MLYIPTRFVNAMRAVMVIKLLFNCFLVKRNNYAFGELTHTNDQLLHSNSQEYNILPILNPLKTVHFQPP